MGVSLISSPVRLDISAYHEVFALRAKPFGLTSTKRVSISLASVGLNELGFEGKSICT